jgi:hypothetical protein
MIKLKDLLLEGESIWALGTGMGTKRRPVRTYIGRRNTTAWGKEKSPWVTPEDWDVIKNMSREERHNYIHKKRQDFLKSRGLCIRCGKNPPATHPDGTKSTRCQNCIYQSRLKRQEKTQDLSQHNICIRCQTLPSFVDSEGKLHKYCKKCLDYIVIRRKELFGKGLCIDCGQNPAIILPNGKKLTRCASCTEKLSSWRNEKIKRGLCTTCGKPAKINLDGTTGTKCKDCAEKGEILRKNLDQRRIEQGICTRCGKNPAKINLDGTKSSYCPECLEKIYKRRKSRKEPALDYSIE